MSSRVWLSIRSFAQAGIAAATVSAALRYLPAAAARPLTRTNHRGEPISLRSGPALVGGVLAGIAQAPLPGRARAGLAIATAAAGILGAIDDFGEGASRKKGLKGHVGALLAGQVTTGAIKILGLAAAGIGSAALIPGSARPSGTSSPILRAADAALGGAVIAGCANLINLLDLRPGRALKVVLVAAPLVGARSVAGLPQLRERRVIALVAVASAAGAGAALLREDLAEQTMLGDTGANAAGAVLGAALVSVLGRRGQLVALGVLSALTLASERISFTKVIEGTAGLREFDGWGRRPR